MLSREHLVCKIPVTHPRYASLMTRERIVEGVEKGITSLNGMIAQGRGEAFDYLIGERTIDDAMYATRAAVALLILAERPVISVNGNTAALMPEDMVKFSRKAGIPLEVNLFYRTEKRVRKIIGHLEEHGAVEVLGAEHNCMIPCLDHERAKTSSKGIFSADVVLVPLEDGDRCETLVKMGKKVICVDLNPISRTSRMATISIVDNVVRVIPNMSNLYDEMCGLSRPELEKLVESFDNQDNLKKTLLYIGKRMNELNIEGNFMDYS